MSEAFDKWWVKSGHDDLETGRRWLAVEAFNLAVDAVVEALRRRERLFRSKVEGEAVLNDIQRLKVES